MEFAMQINQITKNIISLTDLDSLFDDHCKGSDFNEHLIGDFNEFPINDHYSKL